MPSFDELSNATYISLETFRKDGSGVKTPVWVAGHQNHLVVITNGTSFKVKRLVANPACRIARCNVSGSQILGDWQQGQCEILPLGPAFNAALAPLRKKYGIQFWLLEAGAWLGRKRSQWVVLQISLNPPA